jgi:hypothetical protein
MRVIEGWGGSELEAPQAQSAGAVDGSIEPLRAVDDAADQMDAAAKLHYTASLQPDVSVAIGAREH